MKLKKRYIIILILLLFIPVVFLIFKNKSIQINTVFNKNNKLATYEFEQNRDCDQWLNEESLNDLITNKYGLVDKIIESK